MVYKPEEGDTVWQVVDSQLGGEVGSGEKVGELESQRCTVLVLLRDDKPDLKRGECAGSSLFIEHLSIQICPFILLISRCPHLIVNGN